MAHGLTTPVTTDSSATVESALVKNADGSAISNPVYVDAVFDTTLPNGRKRWLCSNDAPGGTYPAGSQQFRLKGTTTIALSQNGTTMESTTATPAPTTTPTPTTTPPTYGITLSSSLLEGGSISFATSFGHKIAFNEIANASSSPADVVFTKNGQSSYATIPGEYVGQPFAFFDSVGTRYDTDAAAAPAKFIDGTVNF